MTNRSLVRWIEEASTTRGLRFSAPDGTWDPWSYAQLAELTLRASTALRQRGVGAGDVVTIVQRSSPGFVSTLFGAMNAGATACSVAPPFAMQRADDYARHVSHLLNVAQPRLVVCDAESIEHVTGPLAALGLDAPVLFDDLVDGVTAADGPRQPTGTALLQFTSGSSGFARGVRISAGALQANIDAMRDWLEWDPALPGGSWLPVHHDMGLIGCLMNMVVTACDTYIMQPDEFVRSPLRYLTCLSENRVALTAMPNFGLAYILRRVRPEQLAGLRFDALRGIIIGAERIDPRVLRNFADLLGPFGMDHRALLPAYGGAEATLCVSGLPLATGWTAAAPRGAEPGVEMVGCGRPMPGLTVRVTDDDGAELPDGDIGEIVVTGTSVATEYVGAPGTASGTRLADAELRTGDAGFLTDGELYVIGRLGDGLKVRGRMVFAESLEVEMFERGVPERRSTVLLGVRDGVPTGAVIFEKEQDGWAEIAGEVLREALDEVDLIAVSVPRGGLVVTSSGKPRRRVMWKALTEGTLRGEVRPLPEPIRAPARPVDADQVVAAGQR